MEVASRATTREQAAAALRRAQRLGDEVMALAVYNIAAERDYVDVVADYVASRPERAAALAALAEHDAAFDPAAPSGSRSSARQYCLPACRETPHA